MTFFTFGEATSYGEDEVRKRFGGMVNAFRFGAPPPGGYVAARGATTDGDDDDDGDMY